MSWRDPNFRYTPLAKQGEGYLARKFKQIKAEQKKREEETARVVKPIIKAKAA